MLILIVNLSVILNPKKVSIFTYIYFLTTFLLACVLLYFTMVYLPKNPNFITTVEDKGRYAIMQISVYLKVIIDYFWGYFLLRKILNFGNTDNNDD
jgi:ATP/ADP translocase